MLVRLRDARIVRGMDSQFGVAGVAIALILVLAVGAVLLDWARKSRW